MSKSAYPLKLPLSIKKAAQRLAKEHGVSLNQWIRGIPRIGEVVGHANPDLERSTIRALKEWRYEPATCNGKPVEVETVLRVNYSLSRQTVPSSRAID